VINLDERQAARFLGIGARTLWQLRKERAVPYVRFGKTVLYPKPLLVKWLLERAEVVHVATRDGCCDSAVAAALGEATDATQDTRVDS
jgi:hypothetical protein